MGGVLRALGRSSNTENVATPSVRSFPTLATQADELCMVRSMTVLHRAHQRQLLFAHRSWVGGTPFHGILDGYGLGNENETYRRLWCSMVAYPSRGLDCFGSGFLPPEHQAQRMVPRGNGPPNIQPRETPDHQRRKLMHCGHWMPCMRSKWPTPSRCGHQKLELAFRMQAEVPDLMELANEPDWLKEKYGFNHQYEPTRIYAAECMLARRMVERGRFVELTRPLVDGDRWDQHSNPKQATTTTRAVDQPIAALLEDLKVRGLLDETLVVFAGEFGRTRLPRATTDAITIHMVSPSGWQVAEPNQGRSTARRTILATTRSKILSRSTICTPR